MNGMPLHEALARERHRYERLVFMRMGGAISQEDAQDIVSDALLRAQRNAEANPPEPGKEDAWFGRVVLNQGIDFLRARDGRPRNGNGNGNGNGSRPVLVRLTDLDDDAEALAIDVDDLPRDADQLAGEAERSQAEETLARVLASLTPEDVELILLRHVIAEEASRACLAEMAGLTVAEFRWRYQRAWKRFVDAVALDAPTPRCGRVRAMLGDLEAGIASSDAVAEIDAHTLDCPSCRVFARESYRALELLPVPPAAAGAHEWASRIASLCERSGQEVAAGAGAAAAGAGLWGLLGGGSAAGVLKAAAVLCSATAVTAGVCAGVLTVVEGLGGPEKAPAAKRPERRAARATATPTPTPTAVATPAPTVAPAPTAAPRQRSRPRTTTADTSGESEIPAAAAAGASEFEPGGSTAPPEPAPATDSGGGEFAP